jgi:hypothetical protein
LAIFLHFTRWVLSRIVGWLGFFFSVLPFTKVNTGLWRGWSLGYKRLGLPHGQKYIKSELYEWLVDMYELPIEAKTNFLFM